MTGLEIQVKTQRGRGGCLPPYVQGRRENWPTEEEERKRGPEEERVRAGEKDGRKREGESRQLSRF